MSQAALQPISFRQVSIDDAFWAPRLAQNRERTIPHQYAQLRDTGRLDALRLTWQPGQEPVPHIFWESDVAKWLEAASYSLATHPDPALDALVDETIALLAGAQQPDGYLNVYFTVVKPGARWTDLHHAHELYCAGHLIEAGVAHVQATGKRSLLEIVCRYADYIETVFGRAPGQKRGYCGHEEIELALVKLYRATGQRRYLNLASYFVDERGQSPAYFVAEKEARGGTAGYFGDHERSPLRASLEYNQAHAPVREQTQVVGHAVRAVYLYTAMADLAAETADPSLTAACQRLWTHLCSTRLYVTGGLGTTAANEGFTTDYDLPNETAYAETCASIGLVFWAQRMLLLTGAAHYVDVLERALYNGAMSGVSLDGTAYFYENPLASDGSVRRQEWFGCACCPPNLARLLASLGDYIYAAAPDGLLVNLYVGSQMTWTHADQPITVRQQSRCPWDGEVTLALQMEAPSAFTLSLRVPAWCPDVTVSINGQDTTGVIEHGYLRLPRTWAAGDTVHLRLAMPVLRLRAHPRVRADVGLVALQRGPIIYCAEEEDQTTPLDTLIVPAAADLIPVYTAHLLGGVVLLRGSVLRDDPAWADTLYRSDEPQRTPTPLTAIPYYAWNNRRQGPMRVWLRAD